MRHGLSVIPHMGARARAARRTGIVVATFPAPDSAIGLAQDGGRFEDAKIGRDRLDQLGWQRAVVEAIAEAKGAVAQCLIMIPPISADAFNPVEVAGIPGAIGISLAFPPGPDEGIIRR